MKAKKGRLMLKNWWTCLTNLKDSASKTSVPRTLNDKAFFEATEQKHSNA